MTPPGGSPRHYQNLWIVSVLFPLLALLEIWLLTSSISQKGSSTGPGRDSLSSMLVTRHYQAQYLEHTGQSKTISQLIELWIYLNFKTCQSFSQTFQGFSDHGFVRVEYFHRWTTTLETKKSFSKSEAYIYHVTQPFHFYVFTREKSKPLPI